jgi:leucyl-tRNA synthetase
MRRDIYAVLSQATYDVQRMQFNTVASAAMKILNAMQVATATAHDSAAAAQKASDWFWLALHECTSILLRVLSPITPHVAHVLWQELGFAGDLMTAPWPEVDESALETDEIELVLQVNGKLRGHMRAPKSADRAAIERLALQNDAVRRHTNGQPPKKVVVVPGRLVNVVV